MLVEGELIFVVCEKKKECLDGIYSVEAAPGTVMLCTLIRTLCNTDWSFCSSPQRTLIGLFCPTPSVSSGNVM
jgi:hypothetical protein